MRNRLLGILLSVAATLPLEAQEGFTPVRWETLPEVEKLPEVTESIPLPDNYRSLRYEVSVEFPELQALDGETVEKIIKEYGDTLLPYSPVAATTVTMANHKPYLTISFTPVVCRNGVYSRINSYKLAVKTHADNSRAQAIAKDTRAASAESSVLASGRFVKIAISSNGVYAISNQTLKSMGFSNPDRVRAYGYGGWLMSETFASQPGDDLPEVPLWHTANGVLLYARGTVGWSRSGSKFVRSGNCYSDTGYYFLTEVDSEEAYSFPAAESFTSANAIDITTFNDYTIYEKDNFSWSNTGRELYELYDYSDGNSRSYNLTMKDAADEQATMTVAFSAKSSSAATTLSVEADGTALGNVNIASTAGDYYVKGVEGTADFTLNDLAGKEKLTVKLTHNRSAGISGHLNYIALNYKRKLTLTGNSYVAFRSLQAMGKASTFIIEGADASTVVWDVTDPNNYKQMQGTLSGSSYSFSIPVSSGVREFVAVNTAGEFSAPDSWEEVANQNLHAMTPTDMVIIVPSGKSVFLTQAERLAQAHREHDGLTVEVVTAQQVYNEFSSGTPDATAYRRLMKMLYDRYTDEASAPKYLLLFGDCTFDNRMLTSTWSGRKQSDYLLSYQVATSNDEKRSYLTDDYFGFLDDNEGASLNTGRLDIGVGRIPAASDTEAKDVVDKILDYMYNNNAGDWKRTVTFVADDAEGSNSDNSFMEHAVELAESVTSLNPAYKVERLLADAYKRESSSTGYSYPELNKRLAQLFDDGMIMLNYTGHSGTTSWSEENLLTTDDISKLTSKRVPLWFTASCDFARFDEADDSGGEMALLNSDGGAIGVISTSRVVYDVQNFMLHRAVIKTIFSAKPGERLRLGDIMRISKQADSQLLTDANKLNFNLLGDPALALALPEYTVKVTQVADSDNGSVPTIKAGEKVKVVGEIVDADGERIEGFNGTVNLLAMDSRETVSTLDNIGEGAVSYTDHVRTIFNGTDSVRNGVFEMTLPVPLDINYSGENGMMKLYALSSDKQDACGSFNKFNVGGTADGVTSDGNGPAVSIYLNTPDFEWGGKVNSTPYFVANIEDADGINTSGNGIGHDLTLTIDGKTSYSLNNYYKQEAGDYTRGSVGYSIPELTEGEHTLSFKAWDTMNNPTTKTLSFVVVKGLRPSVTSLTVSESPARTSTTFILAHNRPMSSANIRITVSDMAGRQVWMSTESDVTAEEYHRVDWDLTDSHGRRVQAGIYLFKAEIDSDGSKQATKTEKLVVLAQ